MSKGGEYLNNNVANIEERADNCYLQYNNKGTTTTSDDKYEPIKITPNTWGSPFTIYIKEKKAPDGFEKLNDGKVVTVNIKEYDSNGKVTKIETEPAEVADKIELLTNGNIKVYNEKKTVDLNFYKYAENGTTALTGAEIAISKNVDYTVIDSITGGTSAYTSTYNEANITGRKSTTENNNKFETVKVGLSNFNEAGGTFDIYFQETKAPKGYRLLNNGNVIKITVKYDENGKVIGMDPTGTAFDKYFDVTTTGNSKLINAKKTVDLNFYKYAENGTTALTGAEIAISKNVDYTVIDSITGGTSAYTSTYNEANITGRKSTTENNNKFETVKVGLSNFNEAGGTFDVYFQETKAPSGYKLLNGGNVIKLTVTYDKDGKVQKIDPEGTESDKYFSVSDGKIPVKNELLKVKLDFEKTDMNGELLSGATLRVLGINKDSNIKTVAATKDGVGKKGTFYGKTNIPYEEIQVGTNSIWLTPTENTGTVLVKVEEIKVPTGYTVLQPIDIKVTYNTAPGDVTEMEKLTGDVTEKYDLDTSKDKVTVKNEEIGMSVGGVVWLDEQKGDKAVVEKDGEYDAGEEIGGVKVALYKNGKQVTRNLCNKEPLMTTTAEETTTVEYKDGTGAIKEKTVNKGEYFFPNVEMGTDYEVIFTYDGIKYETIKVGNNYASEDTNKASEVGREEFNKKYQTINKETGLKYKFPEVKGKTIGDDTIENELLTIDEITATSGKYLEKTTDAETVWDKDGSINEDHYILDVNCGLRERYFDLALGTDVDSAKVSINGKDTTYNYNQIMSVDGKINIGNTITSSSDVIYNLYLYQSDYNYRIEDYKTDPLANKVNDETNPEVKATEGSEKTDAVKELEVEVTYKIILMNQTQKDAKISRIDYDHDDAYTFKEISEGAKFNTDNKEITFEKPIELNANNNYRQDLYITFTVNKDKESGNVITKEFKNVAEILEYSTVDGLVDWDSCPGNRAVERDDGKVGYEDDTDEAQGLNVVVNEEAPRIISGNVFDDGKFNDGDGKLNDPKVNDVTVQLIEIKNIGGTYYEYIWQETKTGSKSVKTTGRNGYEGTLYTNSVVKDSDNYEFTDFIPGNYIVRFIYGDGTTENILKYNGQDYQSTIDKKYDKEWYNTAEYVEGEDSKARDNEDRRLETMAQAVMIDNETFNNIENYWMAAETSKINVPVDVDTMKIEDDKERTPSDTQEVAYRKDVKSINFNDIHFGLALRPQTKLELEKHIIALKIAPTGTGTTPIIDAKVDGEGKIGGVRKGLSTMPSTRDNRNYWKVETDVEELVQGATLEAEYTYTITDNSDVSYLSKTLVDLYKDNIGIEIPIDEENSINGYAKELKEQKTAADFKGLTHTYGELLGTWYYTKTGATEETKVPSRVETLQEAVNPDLVFENPTEEMLQANKDLHFKQIEQTNTNEQKESYINTDSEYVQDGKTIKSVIENVNPSEILTKGVTDSSKKVKLTTKLAASTNGDIEGNFPSYLAEITKYSNAAGRRDAEATPNNLIYAHSDDTNITLNNSSYSKNAEGKIVIAKNLEGTKLNEKDDFWAETIIITKPTGEDKTTSMQIIIAVSTSLAVIGVGIILIKKYVIKK